jgi:uncharacterized protein YjlB
VKTETFVFADDGDIPNSRHPLIVYRGAVNVAEGDVALVFERLFRSNGWGRGWRASVFPFHHYHSNTHEALGIAAGEADVRFGGEAGRTLHVVSGDALLIPAGVGHKRLTSADGFLVVGCYPPGAPAFDLLREGAEDKSGIRARIAAVPFPATDPVGGAGGPVSTLWGA